MGMAVRLAGFEMRDTLQWLYGTGFPKSLDVSKAIDSGGGRPEDIRRMQMGDSYEPSGRGRVNYDHGGGSAMNGTVKAHAPKSEAARQWSGWGTALKPAYEPIILARKPLRGTVAANVQAHGTGAINVDGCRIEARGRPAVVIDPKASANGSVYAGRQRAGTGFDGGSRALGTTDLGRWPANVLLDEDAAAVLDAQSGELASPATYTRSKRAEGEWLHAKPAGSVQLGHGDSGGASRFFYTAKASASERGAGLQATNGGRANVHPTVKPVALMRWLVRLVTPPGGIVLDPFTGSGTTGVACMAEGFRFIGIERETEYVAIARARIEHAMPAQLDLLAEAANA